MSGSEIKDCHHRSTSLTYDLMKKTI